MANTAIAREVRLSRAMVAQWRQRFAEARLAGLNDTPRPGAPPKYDGTTERRILAQLDAAPPEGHAIWNGRLVAQILGDVSAHQVWRMLRRHGIHLQRRRSWCVSTDPQFAQKAADIVALYLDPPDKALVLSIDEKPAIQGLSTTSVQDVCRATIAFTAARNQWPTLFEWAKRVVHPGCLNPTYGDLCN